MNKLSIGQAMIDTNITWFPGSKLVFNCWDKALNDKSDFKTTTEQDL